MTRVYTLQNAAVERGIVVNWNASAWLTSPGQSPPREALLKKKKNKKHEMEQARDDKKNAELTDTGQRGNFFFFFWKKIHLIDVIFITAK